MPLFAREYESFASTQDYVRKVLDLAAGSDVTRHLEIETYTWNVLPAGLKVDLLESIAREYRLGPWRHPAPIMMRKTVVLDVVGLTPSMIGRGGTAPNLARFGADAAMARIDAAFPAVTCTAQANYLTGRHPSQHGIVGNGWYSRDECEIKFWKQSNGLVQGPKVWDRARAIDPAFTCANVFWWYNMYSSVDYSVTPRPMYPADGRKLPDVYTTPPDLRGELQSQLGQFPLFDFWGPKASIASTRWIAESAKHVERRFSPTLTLVYLPHLDYNLQRVGPERPGRRGGRVAVDAVCGDLISFYEGRGAQVIVLSEYGLSDVSRPVHLNRALREHGFIAVREELGLELLDAGASAAFAVADHQVAHVYVNDSSKLRAVRDMLEKMHRRRSACSTRRARPRSISTTSVRATSSPSPSRARGSPTTTGWTTRARRTSRGPSTSTGSRATIRSSCFVDPAISTPAVTIGWKVAKKKLGFRSLLDVISLDASLVKGSHGRPGAGDDGPMVMTRQKSLLAAPAIDSVDVHSLILAHLGAPHAG